jgi:hypothetical protein
MYATSPLSSPLFASWVFAVLYFVFEEEKELPWGFEF